MIGLLGFGLIALLARLWAWRPRPLWGALALWWLFLFALHLSPFASSALAQRLGGDARAWGLAGGFAALVFLYARLLAALRQKAQPSRAPAPAQDPAKLSPEEVRRFARHITLREIGGPGQQRLKAARVLIVGLGGLGAPAALYLGASGIGQLDLMDDDSIAPSNLPRQVLFTPAMLGQNKAEAAAAQLAAQCPGLKAVAHQRRFDAAQADLVKAADLILDCTDNFETRAALNAAAVAQGKPLLSAAVTPWEGQIGLYHPAGGGACYACLFPQAPAPGLVPDCATAGVAGPLPGVLGTMLALEAVKFLTGAGEGEGLRGHLFLYDGLRAEARRLRVPPRKTCPICAGLGASALDSSPKAP